MTDAANASTISTAALGLPLAEIELTQVTERLVDSEVVITIAADMLVRDARGERDAHIYDLNGRYLAAVPRRDRVLRVFVARVQFNIMQSEVESERRFSGSIFADPLRDDGTAGYETDWSRTLAHTTGDSPFAVMDALVGKGITTLGNSVEY